MGVDSQMRSAASHKVLTVILAIGFGLHNAWVCAAMYSPAVLGASVRLPGVLGGSHSLLYLVSIVGFAVTAFVAAACDQSLLRFARSRKIMLLAAGLTCAGTSLALIPLAGVPAAATMAEIVSGLVTGVGSAVLAIFWGIALSRSVEHTSAVVVPVGVVLGFALNALLLQGLPTPVGGLICAAIPLVECACLWVVTPLPNEELPLKFNALDSGKVRFGALILEATACVGMALGVLKQTAVQATFSGDVTPAMPVVLFTAGGMVVALCVVYTLVHRGEGWDPFFNAVCPAAACVSLVAAFFVAEYGLLFDLFLLATYFLYESLLWMYGAVLAHRLRLSPIFLFGLIRGMATVAMFLGAVVISYVVPLTGLTSVDPRSFVFIPLVLVLLARAAAPRESQILRKAVRCPAIRLIALEMDDRLALLEASRSAEGGQQAASVPSAPASPAVGTAFSGVAGTGSPVPDASSDAGGRFTRRVRKVAQMYLLTERETDILFDLAKGNTAAYIQEKHCISAGTVKTHVRNIYRKLDIHKRNDLMRLIDEIDDYE